MRALAGAPRQLHVRIVAAAPTHLPAALGPARGACVTITEDGNGGRRRGELLGKLFLFVGAYTYYQPLCPSRPLYAVDRIAATLPAHNTTAPELLPCNVRFSLRAESLVDPGLRVPQAASACPEI